MKTQYFSIKEAERRCGVTRETLRNWEKAGKLNPVRTPGGHRRYTEGMLDEVLNLKSTKGE